MGRRQRGTDFRVPEMTQTAFETCEVVNIQMVRERKLLYNGNRVSAFKQVDEVLGGNLS